MYISELINHHGEKHRPYMRGLVNHLPMAQVALYKMTGDMDIVQEFTDSYVKKTRIDPVKEDYTKVNFIEDCVGNRELYEGCLDLIKKEIEEKNIYGVIRYVLNTYPLGMSSGLFHTIIRVAYAVEGYKTDKALVEEIARSLAYYVTAYREAKLFNRKVDYKNAVEEMKTLINDPRITEVRQSQNSMGQKLRTLYSDREYMEKGFTLKGEVEEKVWGLLDIMLPAYINSGDIVTLHCITGLHALLVLREYFDDFDTALDIMTTCIITHMLTLKNLEIENGIKRLIGFSWTNIISMGADSPDVHTIKLTHSCSELSNMHSRLDLKMAVKKRIIG